MMKTIIALFFVFSLEGQALAQFPGITYRGVDQVRNCNFATTPYQSVHNVRYAMFGELFALPSAAPILSAFKIKLVTGPVESGSPPLSVMTSQGVAFESAVINEAVIITVVQGEKSCASNEYNALVGLVALNNASIDAVLSKYGVELNQLIAPYAPIFPRP
jgi:hypothetical protein